VGEARAGPRPAAGGMNRADMMIELRADKSATRTKSAPEFVRSILCVARDADGARFGTSPEELNGHVR
jgi:hypothetical protein